MRSKHPSRVLLVGENSDPELQAVRKRLEARGVRWTLLSYDSDLSLRIDGVCAAWRLGEVLWRVSPSGPADPAPFVSAFVRSNGMRIEAPAGRRPGGMSGAVLERERFYRAENAALRSSFLEALESAGCRMYNSIRFFMVEKPLLLFKMASVGVPVPDSLFTRSPDEFRGFARKFPQAILKPVTEGYARRLKAEDLRNAGRVSRAPVTLNRFVEGRDARLYVCDGEVVSGSWSEPLKKGDLGNSPQREFELAPSPKMKKAAIRAASVCGLRFSGVDLRIGEDGEFVILECNSMPSFIHVESQVGTPISDHVASALAKAPAK